LTQEPLKGAAGDGDGLAFDLGAHFVEDVGDGCGLAQDGAELLLLVKFPQALPELL